MGSLRKGRAFKLAQKLKNWGKGPVYFLLVEYAEWNRIQDGTPAQGSIIVFAQKGRQLSLQVHGVPKV